MVLGEAEIKGAVNSHVEAIREEVSEMDVCLRGREARVLEAPDVSAVCVSKIDECGLTLGGEEAINVEGDACEESEGRWEEISDCMYVEEGGEGGGEGV